MSLLEKLQNALNKVYDGNTVSSDEAKQDGVSHVDTYKCDCGNIVPEEEWIDELKMCKECYTEHYGGSFISPDQAEYQKGER